MRSLLFFNRQTRGCLLSSEKVSVKLWMNYSGIKKDVNAKIGDSYKKEWSECDCSLSYDTVSIFTVLESVFTWLCTDFL